MRLQLEHLDIVAKNQSLGLLKKSKPRLSQNETKKL